MATKATPFWLEPDESGCEKCHHGDSWRIIKPNGSMHHTTYEDQNEAEDICDLLNEAYEMGKSNAK